MLFNRTHDKNMSKDDVALVPDIFSSGSQKPKFSLGL